MALNMSAAKRRALVKLQLRDKHGRWIEMGGGVKWYSSKLKKQITGTVVGTKGDNALVRLDKDANSNRNAPLVSVPAHTITVVDQKASLAPNSAPGKPVDQTSEFEKPLAVANESNGAPKANGYVKPSDSPEDWKVSVTSDGNAYVGRSDGAELYFPARSLEVGDVLVAPHGGDETKPFSIGKGWAKKGVERVNADGPKTGTVLRIEGDRYAVVQLPDGFTVEDKKHPGEQTDLITVGLSNSVIKLTDGMKAALGDHLTDTFDGNANEQEVDDSEEAQSDHVGREVPEEDAAAEADPADVDLTDITDGEEADKAAPISEKARELDVPQADNSGSDDQSLNENGLTDDEQKMVKAYDRMAQRAYDKGDIENGDTYSANANRLRKLGEDRRAGAKADHENPSDTPVKDPQNAPQQVKAPEPTPATDSASELDQPKEISDAEKKFDAIRAEIRDITDIDDPRRQASDSADQNALDSENDGIAKYSDEWYDIWNSTYGSALDDLKSEADQKARNEDANREVPEDTQAPNLEEPNAPESSRPDLEDTFKPGTIVTHKRTGKLRYVQRAGYGNGANKYADGYVITRNIKNGKPFGPVLHNVPGDLELPKDDPFRPARVSKLPGREGTYTDGADYETDRLTPEDNARFPVGTMVYGVDDDDPRQFSQYVKIADDQWIDESDRILSDSDMMESQYTQAIFLPDNERNKISAEEVQKLADRYGNKPSDTAETAPESAPEAPEATKANVSLDDLEKQAKADGDTVLYHGGLPEGTTLDDIDLNRNGTQQNKRGRSFGGFYLTDESSKSWSDKYAMERNGVMHGFAIDKNARIDDRGSEQIDRLSAEDRAKAAETSDVIKGKDMLGRTQYVILNKDVVKGVGETNIKEDKSSENPAPEVSPEPPEEGVDAPVETPESSEWTRGFVPMSVEALDSLPIGTVVYTNGVAAKTEVDGKLVSARYLLTKTPEGWSGKGLSSEDKTWDQQQNAPQYIFPEDSMGGYAVHSLPKGTLEGVDWERFDGNVNGLEPGDYVKLKNGMVGNFTVRKNGKPAIARRNGVATITSITSGDKVQSVRKLNKDESEGTETTSDEEISSPAPEAAPETPEDAPEGFTPTGDQPYPNLGADMPTLLKQTVRGKARTELEFFDETSRESEYDQGYRMNQGKIEVYDFDRALSSLEDNISAWYQYQEAIPTRENPNASGYTAGHTKAQINAVINGIEKLQEAIRAAKTDRDGQQQSEPEASSPDAAPEDAPEAPQDVVDAPETAPESSDAVDGEPDATLVSHLNENAVLGDDDERRAAGLYLGGARYNAVLRDGNVPEAFQQQIDSLTGFIDKQPEFGQETTLYRGMPGNYLENAKDRVGEVVTEPAFMSTSLKRSEAQIFAGSSNGSGVLMELKARPEDKALSINAAYMTDQSGIPEEYRQPVDVTAREAEMLMKPNTAFKINGVEEKEIDGKKYQYVQAEVVDAPEAPSNEEGSSEEQLNERGLTQAEEDQYEQHMIDADVEARAGDDYGVQEYRDKADEILKKGEKRLAEEEAPSEETSSGNEIYTEGGPGRVPAYKATVQAIKDSGVESVRISASDATKKDFTPEEIEHRLDKQEKTGLHDYIFDLMPKEFKRFKDQDSPADPINLPEAEEVAPEASKPTGSLLNLKPTPEEQAQLDEFDKAMDAAVASDDTEAFDKASDAKYDLMESIAGRPEAESTPAAEESYSDSAGDSSGSDVHPLDALGIERRTPEAIDGEDYAPTQQQQDVIDAVLGGLDTKVQAMAGTGKTSTLVALSRRIGEKGGQAIYIAFNKTVQEEAERRMEGLPVEAKTGHGVAYQWAQKNMPHLNIRMSNLDPTKPIAFYKDGQPKNYSSKFAWTSAQSVGNALGINAGDVKEESGIPLTKSAIVLAVKKTVGTYALSDKDTILPEHVPDSFEIAEKDLPKIVDLANEYWADLGKEDGNFRVTHDTYRKFWALSKPDLTDGTGGNAKGANILYIDEAQDTPPVLAKVVADQKMQKVIVGDQNQAIYAFAENIDYLSEADGDIELPLNKSWRFGPEVADAGNRFLEMLGSDNRVVGGGGPSKVTYGMEDADAVLVRTNAGMIQAILEETQRDRRVTAPKGTRANLESMVETVEALKDGYAPDNPHDDLIGFKNWEQVLNAYHSGDNNVAMIVKLFDVVDKRSLKNLKPSEIEALKEKKMADAKNAIDHLVIDVPLFNSIKMVQKGDRTYLEPVDENPFPVDAKGKQKPWGPNEKKWAVSNFSASLGLTRKPYLREKGLDFGAQMLKYRKEGGIETVGWIYEGGKHYTEDENVVKKFATYSGISDVTVSTAHKSKGLEWDRVRVGDDFIGPYEDAKTGAMVWPEDDEYKLGYVALTRAAKELDPGSLSYVYDHTSPNGGVPGKKKSTDAPAPVVSEDSDPDLGQVVEESPMDSAPDTEEDLDISVEEEFGPDVAPAPEPEVEATPEPTPEPEIAPVPESAPESAPEAPLYDDITGLTVEEEAHKDDLLKQAKEAKQRGNWDEHGRLIKEINSIFDMGRERWKAQHAPEKKQKSQPAPKPVEPEVAPEPETPVVSEPVAPAIPASPYDHEGLTPQERRRADELERWINDVYRGKGQGNVKKMEDELFDMLTRGDKRINGEPDAETSPVDVTPEFETPAPVADAPGADETPSPVDEVPVAAPVAPKPKSAPTGRKRGQSTVADSNGDQIKVGDTITHKKHGAIVVTGVLPGAGRINFIDPKSGKESSVKGDAVSLKKDEAPLEALGGVVTGTPGERLMDPATGKKAFIGADGFMIVTGQRVRDAKTGQVGTVQTVYTGADKKASVPVLFDGEKEPRRVRGTQLSHADNGGGSDAPETAPLLPETPEPAPEAPKAPEPAPKAPEPAPKAPEPVPAPVVDDAKMARRRAAIGSAPEGSEVRSKDGGEVYTKLTDNFWENIDSTDFLSDDEVMDALLNGERDGNGYIIRTPNVAAPEPDPTPAPAPEPEIAPEPEAPLSGQALADTLTYASTLHMSDGDLAEMMSRYADDPIVFDKIMEIMDERDANVFLPVDTNKTGATFEDQPSLFDDVPEPVATAAAKVQRKLTPQQKASEEYQNYAMAQYFRAVEDLNGVLLNEIGKAHHNKQLAIDIFSGSATIAQKYASEELLQWWRENGRETLASFRFGMYGWEQDRKAAMTARNLGYQRGSRDRDRSNF
jgi:hypothetical protein